MDEHRTQSRLLALGVITLILGHHPHKHPWHDCNQSDFTERFLRPFSQQPAGSASIHSSEETLRAPHCFLFTYSITWGWINTE